MPVIYTEQSSIGIELPIDNKHELLILRAEDGSTIELDKFQWQKLKEWLNREYNTIY